MSVAVADDRALGTGLRVVVTDPARLSNGKRAVDEVVQAIDETCSRFREDSELSRLQAAAGREVRVSPLLLRAMQAAVRGARLTGGAVDPTVGTAVKDVGYSDDFAAVSRDGAAITLVVRPVPGWRCIRINEVAGSVLIPRDVEVDLGSTAKALAADLAARAAYDAADSGVLVSLGGDIATAGAPPPGGWQVQVADSSEAPLGAGAESISIAGGGVATSSTTVRRWRRGGVELHHIIDPATGLPAAGPWRTVSVVAADCLDANIAATAAIVRGDSAPAWLEAARLPARLVAHEGGILRVAGWPQL